MTETIIQLNGFWYKISALRCQMLKNRRWKTIRRTPGRRALMAVLEAERLKQPRKPHKSIERNPRTGFWEVVTHV